MSTSSKSEWETTAVQNLTRYRSSGTYFARFRVGKKVVSQSLKTTVSSVAKQRLADLVREHRARVESVTAFANGKMNVGDAVEVYLRKVRMNVSLKPRSKDYREMMIDFIRRSWPALMETDVRKVTERDCENWLMRYQQQYAPTVVNNSIGTLRAVFDEAISTGARFNNPAADLSRVKVRAKRLELPSREEFLKFVEEIRTAGARQSKDCANLVKFLAYSGVRIGEARFVTWADANLGRRELHVRGDPETATKNGETRYVPMIPELEQMLTELRKERSEESGSATIMRVFECQNSMTNAAEKIGMKRITHHDLRHLFATICFESGVDIPTVSRWLGHKDGGALCMKTYGHLRQEHSFAQAQRVSFGVAA
ncbi:MAG TPA: site-specific integrase [Chthoniobacterales bacterium]|nr:site-specific integrase [Chthoniobacterales bacterium]